MGSFKVFDRQARRFVAAVALLFATVTPALVPALASAATVTDRSIQMSTSAKATSSVSYEVKFTVKQSTGAFVIDFCSGTTAAAIGTACTAPSGLDVGATPTVDGGNTATKLAANTVKVELASAVAADGDVDVTLGGLTTPTDAGTIYARIVTYGDATTNFFYAAADNIDNEGEHLDDGAVALAITDNFAVSGAVLETLVFCASSDAIPDNCNDGGSLDAPSISLGSNGILGGTLSEGTVYTQISTNADDGAVVSLKNSAAGGGLKRVEAATSDITPFTGSPEGTAGTIAPDAAKFGLKLGTMEAETGSVVATNNYTTTGYILNYKSDNSTGVTSAYGDKVYTTNGDPVSNGSVPLIFGANVSPTTPAGNYAATLNLIATGTF